MYRNAWPLLALATYRNIFQQTELNSNENINGARKNLVSEEVLTRR